MAGLAELFAGSISMGLGAYLAAATERKHYVVEEERERREVLESPAEEEEEIYEILDKYGIPREACQGVVESLKRDERQWVQFMMDFELKLEKPRLKMAWLEGLVMGISYFLGRLMRRISTSTTKLTMKSGGLLPMIPYFATRNIPEALFSSIGITTGMLLIFGYVKSTVTGCSKKDSSLGALQTLLIGGIAAGVSYGIVKGMNSSPLFRDNE
jgi:VIT1/CCC1 family predicted Fe2+/Mn2+ transporter